MEGFRTDKCQGNSSDAEIEVKPERIGVVSPDITICTKKSDELETKIEFNCEPGQEGGSEIMSYKPTRFHRQGMQ